MNYVNLNIVSNLKMEEIQFNMYFDYRRKYEGQALLGLREIKEITK